MSPVGKYDEAYQEKQHRKALRETERISKSVFGGKYELKVPELEPLWDNMRGEGVWLPTALFRNSVLGGLEIKRRHGNEENVVIIGCLCFGCAQPVRSFFLLLEKLGAGYAILRKEYCCGYPAWSEAGKQGREQDAVARSRELIGLNVAQKNERGAKRMTHLCFECAYLARRFYPDEADIYYEDLLPRVLEGKKLQLEGKIAYYPGCYITGWHLAPKRDWEFEFPGRGVVDTIEGLQVEDVPNICCRNTVNAPQNVFQLARKRGAQTVVTPCYPCYGNMMRAKLPADMRLMHLTDLLLAAIGQPDPNPYPNGPRWIDGRLLAT